MTAPAAPPPDATGVDEQLPDQPDGRNVRHILKLREQPGPRAALRNATNPTRQMHAYPFLAGQWAARPYLKTPTLAFASLLARHRNIVHATQTTRQWDTAAATLLVAATRDTRPGASDRRVLALAHADLVTANRILTGMLNHTRDTVRVDLDNLWDTYRFWDHETHGDRRRDGVIDLYFTATASRPTS